jgi:hypothetical protein
VDSPDQSIDRNEYLTVCGHKSYPEIRPGKAHSKIVFQQQSIGILDNLIERQIRPIYKN